MSFRLSLLIASGLLLGASAHAAEPADLKKLKVFRNCKDCDLSGAKLQYSALKNADLSGINLSGANLKATDFYSASLVGADLSNANLTEANLGNAILTGANLTGANFYRANLLGAVLTDADLQGAINLGENSVNEAVLCRTKLDSGIESRDCKETEPAN